MKTSILRLFLIASLPLLLPACGGSGSYWEGEANTPAEKIAQKVCNCMAAHLTEKGVDLDLIASADPEQASEDLAKLRAGIGEADAGTKALASELRELGLEANDAPCLDDITREMEAQGIDRIEVRPHQRKKCKFLRIK